MFTGQHYRLFSFVLCFIALAFSFSTTGADAQDSAVQEIPIPGAQFLYIELSPDDRLLAAFEIGAFHSHEVDDALLPIHLIDMESRQLIGTLNGHTDYVSGAAFTRDGRTLATIHSNGLLHIWDVDSQTLNDTFQIGVPGPRSQLLAFSADRLVMNMEASLPLLALWDVETGYITRFLTPRFETYEQFDQEMNQQGVISDFIVSFDVSPDGSSLVVSTRTGNIWRWDLTNGESTMLRASEDAVMILSIREINFSGDGERIYFYEGNTGEIFFLDALTGDEINVVSVSGPSQAHISPDEETIVWLGRNTLHVSSIMGTTPPREFTVPVNQPLIRGTAVFTSNGQQLILGGPSAFGTDHSGLVIVDLNE